VCVRVDELVARDEFTSELGQYLPRDIWPDLANPPVRFEINPVGEEYRSLPELKKDVIQKAIQRLNSRRGNA
jgi:hypothetical protein